MCKIAQTCVKEIWYGYNDMASTIFTFLPIPIPLYLHIFKSTEFYTILVAYFIEEYSHTRVASS